MKWYIEVLPASPIEDLLEKVDLVKEDFDYVNVASPLPRNSRTYESSVLTARLIAESDSMRGKVGPYIVCRDYNEKRLVDTLQNFDADLFSGVTVLGGDDYHKIKKQNDIISPLYAIDEIRKKFPYLPLGCGFSPNADDLESEVRKLGRKIKIGSTFAIADLILDSERFYAAKDLATEAGLNISLIPEVTIVKSPKHLEKLEKVYHVRVPDDYKQRIHGKQNNEARKIGLEIAEKLVEKLEKHDICICAPGEFDSALELRQRFS